MCTIVLARNLFKGFPVVVAANRDELLDRPSELPKLRDVGILAPKDLQRGGMWIGVNQFGLFVGLTNRLGVKSVSGRNSRGELVAQALRCETAEDAYNYVINLNGSSFNGFYMAIADKTSAYYLGGDGHAISGPAYNSKVDSLIIVTNHGTIKTDLDISDKTFSDSSIPQRVMNVLRAWKISKPWEAQPTPENLKSLLEVHDGWRYGTCINQPQENYGTKSSSVIRLEGDKWSYWHRERSSENHICTDKFGSEMNLSINRF